MTKQRQEIPQSDQWNVAAIYPSLDAWEKEFTRVEQESEGHTWPAFQAFKGTLQQGSDQLKKTLEKYFSISRELEKLYTYAHLRNDENIAAEGPKGAYMRALAALNDFRKEAAWLEPALLELPPECAEKYLADEALQPYRFYLKSIFRMRPHTLTADKEELFALAFKAMQTPYKAFSAINNADFKFGKVVDGQGCERDLTHASYSLYMRDRDRALRQNAFTALHRKYRDFENTLAELLGGTVLSHLVNAQARHYDSCLHAALFPNNIDLSVYHSLIAAVRANLDALHRYVDLRKRVLKLDTVHLYDMYVPLVSEVDIKMDYQKAQDLVIASVEPLGPTYQNALRKGLLDERWVDRYENQNKRSGAYSGGCYDSFPYILMNYKETLRDVSTLAHEAGHSMHSFLSRSHQPYQYGDYPIFVAEVASTFNEQLLHRLLVDRAQSDAEKVFLINEKVEELRTTLFRQVMFAEFELIIHTALEERKPLTPQFFREQYRALNAAYFGPAFTIDDELELEWSRIPHFYYNFYVYQYATGLSAALALSDKVIRGGEADREAFLNFLKSGSSAYPLDLLVGAGVDMRTPAPVASAIAQFRSLVSQLDSLL